LLLGIGALTEARDPSQALLKLLQPGHFELELAELFGLAFEK
jgi:hypothetical protein